MIRKIFFIAGLLWACSNINLEATRTAKAPVVSSTLPPAITPGPLGKIVKESLRIKRKMGYDVPDGRVIDYTWVIINTLRDHRSDYKHIRDPRVAVALAWSESSFDANARSNMGCVGLFQVNPQSGREICKRRGWAFSEHELVNNMHFNVRVGLAILDEELAMERGDIHKAVLNYKCGRGAIRGGGFLNARYQTLYARWHRIYRRMV